MFRAPPLFSHCALIMLLLLLDLKACFIIVTKCEVGQEKVSYGALQTGKDERGS